MKKLNSRLTTLASAVGIATIGLGSSALAQAAPVAAGTTISNQATANYTITIDGKETTTSVQSNRVVVTVKPTGSFTLKQDRNIEVAKGQVATFTHFLKNTGNTPGIFNLTAANEETGDDFNYSGDIKIYKVVGGKEELVTGSVTVQPNETLEIRVKGTVPSTAVDADKGKIKLTASVDETLTNIFDTDPSTDTDTSKSNMDTGTVSDTVINLIKTASVSRTTRGEIITYTIEINNQGGANANNVVVADVIPEGLEYQAGSARLTNGNITLTDRGTDADNFQVTDNNGQKQLNLFIPTLNGGDGKQILEFKAKVTEDAEVGDIKNTAEYGIEEENGNKTLEPEEKQTPSNNDETKPPQEATVTIDGNYLGTINDSATDKYADADATSDPQKDDTVKKVATKVAGKETTVSFDTWVHNTGDYEETYGLNANNLPEGVKSVEFYLPGGTGEPDKKLTNGEVTLAKNETKKVIAKVTLKPGVEATTNDITSVVTLTPKSNTEAKDTVKLVIDEVIVKAPGVDITSNGNGTGSNNNTSDNPANTFVDEDDNNKILVPVTVTNNGQIPDEYTLTSIKDNLPEGSIVKIYKKTESGDKGDEVTGPIALDPNNSEEFLVEVTLPKGTPSGTTGTVGTTVTSTNNPTTTDTVYNKVAKQKARDLDLQKNEGSSIAPQGEIVYTHTLTNNGNVTEGGAGSDLVATIETSTVDGLKTTVYIDSNNNGQLDDSDKQITNGQNLTEVLKNTNGADGLSPNESIKVFVKVKGNGKEDLLGKETTTTVTFTPNNTIDEIAAPDAVSVTDTTTVAGLGLYKTQWIDSCDADVSSVTYSITPNKEVAPGECIFYQIKAENTTQYPIKNITINDQIPANTKLNNIPTLNTDGTGQISGLTPTSADASATEVSGIVSALGNGKTATLKFAVKVND